MRTTGSGFTLLEVVVAMAILALALVSVMQVVSQGINHTSAARSRALAMELAEQKLAELQMNKQLAVGEDGGEFGEPYQRYRWQSQVSETEVDGLWRLKVTVLWAAGQQEQSLDLETCYAANLIADPKASAATTSG